MKNRPLAFIILGFFFVFFLFFSVSRMVRLRHESAVGDRPRAVIKNTWLGYKKYFIEKDGRVMRPQNKDTVSEGQAYAMLRAVWMRDKATFDRCYRWTEEHLSRKREQGDNLLAWRWQDGKVVDWMPASDAMLDYALSLIFADTLWHDISPGGPGDYGRKAKGVLRDILDLMLYRTKSGRLYLSPWILKTEKEEEPFPVNASYYSPAHFKIFFEYAGDMRWLELRDTTYFILESLSDNFNGIRGVGFIPDWCAVDANDRFVPLKGKSQDFSWEAVRIPLRIAMDYHWFASPRAKRFLGGKLSDFIAKRWNKRGVVFCEYHYSGAPAKEYENPLFYAAYACLLGPDDPSLPGIFLEKAGKFILKDGNVWVYNTKNDYYTNSLAWFADGFYCGVIRNIREKGNQ